MAVHHILQHLESPNNRAYLMFMPFSPAFNIVNHGKLFFILQDKSLTLELCFWVFEFLSNCMHVVKVKNTCSQALSLSTSTAQGYVLSPLLFSIFTCRLSSHNNSAHYFRYADDTIIIRFISDESSYHKLSHDMSLNTSKTKELIIDI